MTAKASYLSLQELQQRIKSAIEDSLPLPVWVVAEISDLKVNSYSGHCYMELVEKTEAVRGGTSTPKAQARAVIWRNQYAMLSAYFLSQTGSRLQVGMKILAKVMVTYHELYGLSLQISDIDPTYTLGEVERQKQITISQLKADGVWDMNRELSLPTPIQRIAIISSATAAGYQDFCREIAEGGYDFRLTLFEAVVQGERAEESVIDALSRIAEREEEFDVAVMIRGGGSTSDLSCFNSYRLCAYVAQFPLPVLTGIGHLKDESVADMVAHTPLKTPTAVAAWLTQQMQSLEGWLESAEQELKDVVMAKLQRENLRLERLEGEIKAQSQIYCQRTLSRLELYQGQLHTLTEQILLREKERLRSLDQIVASHSPKRIMQLGFAVVRQASGAITSAQGLSAGEQVQIEFAQGAIEAEVKRVLE